MRALRDGEGGGEPLAVVDIGSQTTTLALFTAAGDGVRREEQVRVALPLVRHVSPDRRLSSEAMAEAARVVRKLGRHARRRGCSVLRCVATSAVRDAANAPEVLAEVAEAAGVAPELLDGRAEGEAAAVAVLRTLPVARGVFFDLGGGSLQIGRLDGGRCVRVESFPLGSLRLAGRLAEDPPDEEALEALGREVDGVLAALPWLGAAPLLVGVGGTVRALAKVDRRANGWPIAHSHGYWLGADALDAAIRRLARRPARDRARLGVPPHRARSVVAGAVVIRSVLRAAATSGVRVCGFGLRDGVAYQSLAVPPARPDHRDAPDWALATALADEVGGSRSARRRLRREPLLGAYQEELVAAAAHAGDEDARAALRTASAAFGWQEAPPVRGREGR